MKKKFIPGSDIKEKLVEEKQQELDLDAVVSASTVGGVVHVTTLNDFVEPMSTNKVPVDSSNVFGYTTVEGLSAVDPGSFVSKGEKLIVEALLASLELQVQAERVPSIYKNKLNKEIKRIKNELGK